MRRTVITIVVIVLIALLLALLFLFLQTTPTLGAHVLVASSPPTATSTSTASTQSNSGIDPAVVAALIGLAGVVVGAIIAGGFAVYQTRRNAQLERKMQEAQHKHEQDMLFLQKAIDEQSKT